MEIAIFLLVGLVSFALIVCVAEPQRLFGERSLKKIKVGSTYWGVYEGTPSVEPEYLRVIERKKSTKKELVIAGSGTYEKGRGVKMSGRG